MTDVVSSVVSKTPGNLVSAAKEAGWIIVGTFLGYMVAKFMPSNLPLIGSNRGAAVAVTGAVLAAVAPEGMFRKLAMGAAVGGALEALTPVIQPILGQVSGAVMRD